MVDLDPLRLTWQASGTVKEIQIYAENIDSGIRTDFWNANSTDLEFEISPSQLSGVISERSALGKNRIRLVIQAEGNAFLSDPFDIDVGMTLLAIVFEDGERIKVAASIDNRLIDGYQFEFVMAVPRKDEIDTLSLGGEVSGGRDFSYDASVTYNWAEAKIVYLGPDDATLVRHRIIYDSPS